MSGFQTAINYQPAVGIEGDWCSANPHASMLASAGQLVSGPNGVTAGRFAWADGAGIVRNNGSYAMSGFGRLGFMHRDQPALITTWLAQSTMLVQPNIEVALLARGDVWCKFAAGALPNQKVYANYADGTALALATGSAPDAVSTTAGTIQDATKAMTASITPLNPFNGQMLGGIMTVTSITGTFPIGAIISGGSVVTGTQVLEQLSGTPGGIGTYLVSIAQTQASAALTATWGLFTAAATQTGVYSIGDTLTGANIAAGTQIFSIITGTGGVGTYAVTPGNTISVGQTVNAYTAVETPWYVETYAAAGELAKISVR
jgi:hypothetical protein